MQSVNLGIRIVGITGIPMIKPRDDLGKIICDAVEKQGFKIVDGDIVVVTQKIVSKAEGRMFKLKDVKPSLIAKRIAKSSKKQPELIELILREFETLRRNPISEEELRTSKEQLKGNLLLSLESSDTRMTRLAKNEIYFNRFLPVDEVIDRIDSVTAEQIEELSNELLRPEHLCLSLLGPMTKRQLNRDLNQVWPMERPC